MNKTLPGVIGILIAVVLSGCESENIRNAKQAYENDDYASVVQFLSEEEVNSDDLKEILNISNANLELSDRHYSEAFNNLVKIDSFEENDLFFQIIDESLNDALTSGDMAEVVKIISICGESTKYYIAQLTERADKLDYAAFHAMEKLAAVLDSEEAMQEIKDYVMEHSFDKMRAFLIGKREWEDGEEIGTQVEVKPYENNLIGIVTTVGAAEVEYQILDGDIYWSDFIEIDECTYTCRNLSKNRDGMVVDVTALGTIDYSNSDTMHMHLSAPAPWIMVNADRTWVRL